MSARDQGKAAAHYPMECQNWVLPIFLSPCHPLPHSGPWETLLTPFSITHIQPINKILTGPALFSPSSLTVLPQPGPPLSLV